jgi:ATP-dependent RNA helicase RhlB
MTVLVATPGRLIDYLRTRAVDLSNAEVLVIDEADRMLDMGFIPDVRLIVRHTPPPGQRQTFFFSATFTGDVRKLADQWTRDAVKVEIEPDHVAAETVDQAVYIASEPEKFSIILNLLRIEMPERVLIFVNRRDTAERLWHELGRFNVRAEILSGAISQDKRMRTLEKFREGRLRVLVATDVAGRGLHVEGISHVINYNLPEDPEDYVHRIGRTGRAGANGVAISLAERRDVRLLRAIERYTRQPLAVHTLPGLEPRSTMPAMIVARAAVARVAKVAAASATAVAAFFVRPAWAHSCGCKSRRKLTTASEAKRNCGRATDRGEEAWSETASRWTRTG